jgi:hypothetical protein
LTRVHIKRTLIYFQQVWFTALLKIGGANLRIQRNLRGVSAILTILLILAAAILGGLISYLWAIAPFYATPTNVNLAITDTSFPLYHADHFDVTILNPSYSSSGTNVTGIYLTVVNETEVFNITDTNPVLPLFLDVGTSYTIQCNFNWGAYAGENITVGVIPQSGTGASATVQPAYVKLRDSALFDAAETVQSFVMSANNDPDSAINLTLTGVTVDGTVLTSSQINLTLPYVLSPGSSADFTCNFNWEGHATPDIVAITAEGYDAEITYQVNSSALLTVDNVRFNQNNSDNINVTITNSAASGTPVDLANITIASGNITPTVIAGNQSNPAMPYTLNIGSNVTIDCPWNWTSEAQRNTNLTITAFTLQGFSSQPTTFLTPGPAAAQIDQVIFNLNDTGHFIVNVTNMPYSLYTINVTQVSFNSKIINVTSPPIAAGQQTSISVNLDWSTYLGQTVGISALATYNVNQTLLVSSQGNVTYFDVSNVTFSEFDSGNPYMTVTVYASQLSQRNVTVTQILVQTSNGNQSIDGTITFPPISPSYSITPGTNQTFTCPWNWSQYAGQDVTVIVQTTDGFQASITLKV